MSSNPAIVAQLFCHLSLYQRKMDREKELLKKHPGGLETGPIFQTKLQVRSTFQGLTCGGHEIFAQHVCVSPLPLAAVGHERAIYFPRPLRTQGIWHPIFDVLPNGIYSASVNLQLWPATT